MATISNHIERILFSSEEALGSETEESKVVICCTINGAHASEFASIPTTGKCDTVTAIGSTALVTARSRK